MKINIINACCDLGVHINGSSFGPLKIKEGLINNKNINKIIDITCDNTNKSYDPNDLTKNIDRIIEFSNKLYNEIINTSDDEFNIVIGGDHSIAVASALASVKRNDKLGIVWLDAHPDYNTFDTTLTGNIHGLPLATISGINTNRLCPFHNGNYINPKNISIIGARDIDPLEQVNLNNNKVKVYSTKEVLNNNIDDIINETNKIISNNTNGFHFSIDIDSLDPLIAPGISVGVKDGINKEKALYIIDNLIEKGNVKSIDVVEFNPLFDIDNKTYKITLEIIEYIINKLKDK